MSLKRFYVDKKNISKNTVLIDRDEHNHLKNVLRLQVGDKIVVICGDEFDYVCDVEDVGKTKTTAKIIETIKNQHNSSNKITVFQGLIRKDNMAIVVQKLNELGIANFVPIETRFITAKDKFNSAEKLQKISNQSSKQCKRSIPMQVHNTQNFKEFIKSLAGFDAIIFANELESVEADNANSNNLASLGLNINQKIAIIVGSEGGFDLSEVQKILDAGATSVSLGKRILRAETAAIALSAIILHKIGEI